MKHDGISYRLTMRELRYVLFKKKSCPVCGTKMEKTKTFKNLKGYELNSKSDAFFHPDDNVKSYELLYVCRFCDKEYKLQQLI